MTQESHDAISRQGSGITNWNRGNMGLLFLVFSACFLIYSWTTYSRMARSIVVWTLLHQLLINKMYHIFTFRPMLGRYFFNCSSFLFELLILTEACDKLTKQINKNLTRKTVTNFHGVEWDREEQGPMSCSPICDCMLTFSVLLFKFFQSF